MIICDKNDCTGCKFAIKNDFDMCFDCKYNEEIPPYEIKKLCLCFDYHFNGSDKKAAELIALLTKNNINFVHCDNSKSVRYEWHIFIVDKGNYTYHQIMEMINCIHSTKYRKEYKYIFNGKEYCI